MENILIHPENAEQLRAVKAVLKALKVPFEPQKKTTLAKLTKVDIDQAYSEMREGNYSVVKTADLWK